MDAFANLLMGFQIALTPYNLMIATVGIILGTIIGVLPGLGGANGVAILLPVTFIMPPTSAIILLTCIYWGALCGGAITSILFNIPGEPWSVATTFDGHPMAKQGLGGQALTAVRSAFIGAWMGIKPGGATAASFMSYGLARKFSKTPEKFGTEVLEGVIAPETANNAAGVSALLPMITLGIPGSPTAAIMLGGLLIWGLQPGPLLFQERPDFVWGLIASMYTGNVLGVLIVLLFVPVLR